MWRKGRAVLRAYPELEGRQIRRGPPGVSEITFTTVATATGRSDKTVAGWVRLFLAHEDEKAFLAWAKEQAPAVLAKWEAGLLPAPRPLDASTSRAGSLQPGFARLV